MKTLVLIGGILALAACTQSAEPSRHPGEWAPAGHEGEHVLFIGMAGWGPRVPTVPGDAHLIWFELKSEVACHREAHRLNTRDYYPAGGRIGNLPGYRYTLVAWCEDPSAPWPMMSDPPLMATPIEPE